MKAFLSGIEKRNTREYRRLLTLVCVVFLVGVGYVQLLTHFYQNRLVDIELQATRLRSKLKISHQMELAHHNDEIAKHAKELAELKKQHQYDLQVEEGLNQQLSVRANKEESERTALEKMFKWWTRKDHTSLGSLKVDPSVILAPKALDRCRETEFEGKIDIVIPWINMSECGQTDWPPKFQERVMGRPYAGIGFDRHPWSEVVFAIRSLEKYLAMDHIDQIIIFYDDKKHGPPAFVAPGHPRIRAVAHSSVLAGTRFISMVHRLNVALAYIHHIPGLAEHFLLLPDDVLLQRSLDFNYLIDVKKNLLRQQQKARNYGWVAGFKELPLRHFRFNNAVRYPLIVKKCLLFEMEARYAKKYYKCMEGLQWPLCDFDHYHFHTYVQEYALERKAAYVWNGKGSEDFWAELVIDGMMSPETVGRMLRDHGHVQWLRVSGDGASEELPTNGKLRVIIDDWFFKTFPRRSPLEIAGYMDSGDTNGKKSSTTISSGNGKGKGTTAALADKLRAKLKGIDEVQSLDKIQRQLDYIAKLEEEQKQVKKKAKKFQHLQPVDDDFDDDDDEGDF